MKRAEKENALHSTLGQCYCGTLLAQRLAKHRLVSIAFGKFLEENLTSANFEKSLPVDIYNRIEIAVSIRSGVAANRRGDLDKQGTRLWNLSSKLKNRAKDGEPSELLCLGKGPRSRRLYSC